MSKIAFQRAFQELTTDEVASLIDGARHLEYPADSVIMREGENQHRILVILEGAVRVVRLGPSGQETDLADPLGPGDTVGEMSFIDRLGASATLIARSDVVARAIDRDLVEEMMAKDHTFSARFFHSLLITVIRRLRVLDYKMTFSE